MFRVFNFCTLWRARNFVTMKISRITVQQYIYTHMHVCTHVCTHTHTHIHTHTQCNDILKTRLLYCKIQWLPCMVLYLWWLTWTFSAEKVAKQCSHAPEVEKKTSHLRPPGRTSLEKTEFKKIKFLFRKQFSVKFPKLVLRCHHHQRQSCPALTSMDAPFSSHHCRKV